MSFLQPFRNLEIVYIGLVGNMVDNARFRATFQKWLRELRGLRVLFMINRVTIKL